MGWGFDYTYEGYLSRIEEREIDDKIDECKEILEEDFNRILAYMAASPPPCGYMQDCEGEPIPYAEWLTFELRKLKTDIYETHTLLTHLEEAREFIAERKAKEGKANGNGVDTLDGESENDNEDAS